MTKYYSPDPTALDRGFRALADATRRGMIAQLSLGEASVAELAAPYDMALPSFLQHVRVLESAGLVSTRKEGRVRRCRLETTRLAELDAWITRYQQAWAARLDRLGDFLDGTDTEGDPT
jgi:DNA-binding transcriptional ArsR family regulator